MGVLVIFNKKLTVFLIFALFIVSITTVSASENITDEISQDSMQIIDEDYLTKQDDGSLEASKATQITFDEQGKYYVQSEIPFQLETMDGNPIKGKPVKVIVNDNEWDVETEDDGRVYMTPYKPGNYKVTINFDGDSQFSKSSLTKNIKVLSTLKMNELTKIYNGAIEYTATFYNTDGSLLKNQPILFAVDGKSYSGTTNNKGIATLYVPIKKGNHVISAYNPVSEEVTDKKVKVFDRITGNKNLNVYFNGGIYKIRVYGNDAKPVKAGQKVTIKIDNKKYVVKTDKNGYAKLNIKSNPGVYRITATYKGFEVGNALKVKPILIPTVGKVKIHKTFKDTVKLLTSKGKPAVGKTIALKFNGKTYKAKTNKKGIATFKLKSPSKVGNYKVVYTYGKAKSTAMLSIS